MTFVIIMVIVKKSVTIWLRVTYLLNKSLKENNVQYNENECISTLSKYGYESLKIILKIYTVPSVTVLVFLKDNN
uniref:Uncharacterized protein n=1 Tax=Rhizophagus irregularis (strain DAOM 181602 / DAOM 197198 / MUCL 43194) TaxID=747089 RepID=U9STS0_RHIID